MSYKEFTDGFKKQVFALSYEKQLDFALSICKKLLFDYQNFHIREKWGDPEQLMDAIKFCQQVKNVSPTTTEIESMISHVEAITPDTEDFGDEIGSYALNACAAVLHTLHFLLTKDPLDIFYVGNALYETIDVRVQEHQNLSEEEIDQHRLMQETKHFLMEQTK
jgi:uncharacterized protein YjaG (DUF416 family)